jgi:putative membrane protein
MMGSYFGHMERLGFMPGLEFGIFDLFFMIVFWGLLIWAVFALIRRVSGHGCSHWIGHGWHGQKGNSAIDILKERYAKGEINKEEFEKMKKDLE